MSFTTCTPTMDWHYYLTPWFWITTAPLLIFFTALTVRAVLAERKELKRLANLEKYLRVRAAASGR